MLKRGILAILLCVAVFSTSAQAASTSRGKVKLRDVVVYTDKALVRRGFAGSPLRKELVAIVKAARQEGISPFFLLSISGVESTFGKQACGHNAWGWNSCRGYNFNSFGEGAHTVAQSLRANYLEKWHSRTIEQVGAKYCVGSSWPGKVHYFMSSVFNAGNGMRWNDAVSVVRRTLGGRA